MNRFVTVFVLTAILLATGVANAAKLGVGSTPPPLKVAKWVKGVPVTKFLPGKVYVVEFWATWCGPCLQSIPHITGLAKKYKGKVTFSGINVWDTRDVTTLPEYLSKITKFVTKQGDKMAYNVAIDDMKGTMADTWMRAAEANGIPTAFVIGKDGKIAAIMHPMSLDSILDKVVAGTFDTKAYAAKRLEEEKAAEIRNKPFKLLGEKKYKEAIDEIDKLIASNPNDESEYAAAKVYAMIFIDETAAYAYAQKVSDGCYKNDMNNLAMIASVVSGTSTMSVPELKSPNYEMGLSLAQRSNEIAKDSNPYVLDVLAAIHFKMDNVDKAIEIQQQALSVASKDSQFSEEYTKMLTNHLNTYQKKKSGN